jgi:hypothetical protein
MSFTKARTMVRAQHFNNQKEFYAWKKPVGMPSNPARGYKNSGWLGYGDFLGNAFMSFTKARTMVRAQHFNNQKEFYAWKKPVGMPSSPHRTYADSGWLGYGDFLGTGNPTNQTVFFSFTKARSIVRAQQLADVKAFWKWKKPVGMPSNPNVLYKHSGWTNWYDFLGNKKGGQNE